MLSEKNKYFNTYIMKKSPQKPFNTFDLESTGKEVLEEAGVADLGTFEKIEELVEDTEVSITLGIAAKEFENDINSITSKNVESFAQTLVEGIDENKNTEIYHQVGSLTIAFALMLEEELKNRPSADRPKTVEEILRDNSSMTGAKQLMDIFNFEKNDSNLLGGMLYSKLENLVDTYNSMVVERTGAQRAAVGLGTAATLKALGVSSPVSIIGGVGANALLELLTGNGEGYKKTKQKRTLPGKMSQGVLDTGELVTRSLGLDSHKPFSLKRMERGIADAYNNFTRGHSLSENLFAGTTLALATGLIGYFGYKGFQKLGTQNEGEEKSWKDYIIPAIGALGTVVGGAVLGKDPKQDVSIENKGMIKSFITVKESVLDPVLSGFFTKMFEFSNYTEDDVKSLYTEDEVKLLRSFVEHEVQKAGKTRDNKVIIKIGLNKKIVYDKKQKKYILFNNDFPEKRVVIRNGSSTVDKRK